LPTAEWFLLEGEDLITNSEYLENSYMQNLFFVSDVNDWRQYLFDNIEKFIVKNQIQSDMSKKLYLM
jgi:hypothetical protein